MQKLQDKKIVVTGHCGFIGFNVSKALLDNGAQLLGIDNMCPYYSIQTKEKRRQMLEKYKNFVHKRVNLLEEREISQICFDFAPDIVYHFAAQAGVRYCECNPDSTYQTNVVATEKLLRCVLRLQKSNICQFIFSSSSTVYGREPTPWSEKDSQLSPCGVYASSKLQAEELCHQFAKFFQVTILRLFSVFGPDARPDMCIQSFLTSIDKGIPIVINGNGSTSRDFTHVDDVVLAFLAAPFRKPYLLGRTSCEVINIGSGIPISLSVLVEAMESAIGKKAIIKYHKKFQVDLEITHACIEKAASALSFNPRDTKSSLRKSLKEIAQLHWRNMDVQVVVLCATIGRNTLFSRAITSITSQELRAKEVVIVVDNDSFTIVKERVHCLEKNMPITVLKNFRTKGASGAWNTGIQYIVNKFDIYSTYVAIIDDDDAWTSDHLSGCIDGVRSFGAELIIPGIIRVEGSRQLKLSIPSGISAHDFLVGNPHIQGSNLFIRLDLLCLSGLFDEHLLSCTDRDLMIRVIDVGNFRTHSLNNRWTVFHHTDQDHRLSTPNSTRKIDGMYYFSMKYKYRMNMEEKDLFMKRCKKFCSETSIFFDNTIQEIPQMEEKSTEKFIKKEWLMVGLTTDYSSSKCFTLLQDLKSLADSNVYLVDVFILENGPRSDQQFMNNTVSSVSSSNLRCSIVTLEQQMRNYENNIYPAWIKPSFEKRQPIAMTRTMLQLHLYSMACSAKRIHEKLPSPIVWVLDDDKKLHLESLQDAITFSKKNNISILIGNDIDSPPLPVVFTMRCELVDFTHNLRRIQNCGIGEIDIVEENKTCQQENDQLRNACSEYYHDVSRVNGEHLEWPMWLETPYNKSKKDQFLFLAKNMKSIIHGCPIFRKIRQDFGKPNADDIRGGNTLFFELDLLRVPNTIPSFFNWSCRRSDMIATKIARCKNPQSKILRSPNFIVGHQRRIDNTIPSKEKLEMEYLKDLFGAATYYSMLNEEGDLIFSESTFVKFIETRNSLFLSSIYRIIGCVHSIRRILYEPLSWWWTDKCCVKAVEGLLKFLNDVEECFSLEFWQSNFKKINEGMKEKVCQAKYWCEIQVPKDLCRCSYKKKLAVHASSFYDHHRQKIAVNQLRRLGIFFKDYSVAMGSEGVSIIDKEKKKVYKYLDMFGLRATFGEFCFLTDFVAQCKTENSYSTLSLPLHLYDKIGKLHLVIEREYVVGDVYCGNDKPAKSFLQFVLDCRRANIVCKNVSRKNLIWLANKQSIVLVDFGLDIVPWTKKGELEMMKRIFLTWKWGHCRALTKTLKISDWIPELCGFEYFVKGLEQVNQSSKCILFENLKQSFRRENLAVFYGFEDDLEREIKLKMGNNNRNFCGHQLIIYESDKNSKRVLEVLYKGYLFKETIVYSKREPHLILRDICMSGMIAKKIELVESVDLCKLNPSLFCTRWLLTFPRYLHPEVNKKRRCVLMIKTCVSEANSIESRILHLVSQLEKYNVFYKRFVVIDNSAGVTYHTTNNRQKMELVLRNLRETRWIDEYIWLHPTETQIISTYQKWFGIDFSETNLGKTNNIVTNIIPMLAFEMCLQYADLLLQVDSDLLIGNHDIDPVNMATEVACFFEQRESAITVSLNIYHSNLCYLNYHSGSNFRTEVRGCFIDLKRLFSKLPLQGHRGKVCDFSLAIPGWHRLFDSALCLPECSFRGGSLDLYFIHPTAELKVNVRTYDLIIHCVEENLIPIEQVGKVNAVTNIQFWWKCIPKRAEEFIFVICGLGVSLSSCWKCLNSVKHQVSDSGTFYSDFGVIFIDDFDNQNFNQSCLFKKKHLVLSSFKNVTYIRRHIMRFGSLGNLYEAVRFICTNPASVIILVDMDDILINDHVFAYIKNLFVHEGVDASYGRMLRTDKTENIYPLEISEKLSNCRFAKNANYVWSHLRCFRKYLFDRILYEDLINPKTKWFYEEACDWSFMIPIIEMALHPKFVNEILYYHNASSKSVIRRKNREENISIIKKRPQYSKLKYYVSVVGWATIPEDYKQRLSVILKDLGVKIVQAGYVLVNGGKEGVMQEVCAAAAQSNVKKCEVVSVIGGDHPVYANPYGNTVLSTGMLFNRNQIIAYSNAIIVVGGGNGTLNEVSFGWHANRLIIAITGTGGVADLLAGRKIDNRRDDCIYAASNAKDAMDTLRKRLPSYFLKCLCKKSSFSCKL